MNDDGDAERAEVRSMRMSDDRPAVVLDAWAIVAYYQGEEPARSAVEALIAARVAPLPVLSGPNHMETFASLASVGGLRFGLKFQTSVSEFVQLAEFDSKIGDAVAIIKYAYWLSMAESTGVVTALRYDAELWTGDPRLLCNDRIWKIRDLRDPASVTANTAPTGPVGLRSSVKQELERDGIDLSAMIRRALS